MGALGLGGGALGGACAAALALHRGGVRCGPVIDSHTHLFLCEDDEAEVIARAREAGVTRMLNVGLGRSAHASDGGEDTNATAIAAAERCEGVFASVGCHPTDASGYSDAMGEEIARLAEHDKVRAIGETGIDYYRDLATPAQQRRAFESQIEIARDRALPIVIHCRDPEGETTASDETFEVLDARADGIPVILHCFSAPWRAADAAERGWYCSFAGHVTYPASDELRAVAAELPDELILVETDAPYLAPQTVRGKPNEPAYVVDTAKLVAEVRGVSYEELERTVEANARALFRW
ncbi:MAG TPA: TatD family hydrolase [Solirubrobacterales bacterium]|nr:TatD family hydrolase [Solirubrobacterales bacterium]